MPSMKKTLLNDEVEHSGCILRVREVSSVWKQFVQNVMRKSISSSSLRKGSGGFVGIVNLSSRSSGSRLSSWVGLLLNLSKIFFRMIVRSERLGWAESKQGRLGEDKCWGFSSF